MTVNPSSRSSLSMRDPSHYLIFLPNSFLAEMPCCSPQMWRLLAQLFSINHRAEQHTYTYTLDYALISLSESPAVMQSNIARDHAKLLKEIENTPALRKRINVSKFSYQGSGYELTFSVTLHTEFKTELVTMTSSAKAKAEGNSQQVLGFSRADQKLMLPQYETVRSEDGTPEIRKVRDKADVCFTHRGDIAMSLFLRRQQHLPGNTRTITLRYSEVLRIFGCEEHYKDRVDNFIARRLKPCQERFHARQLWEAFGYEIRRIRRGSGEEHVFVFTFNTDNGNRLALNYAKQFAFTEKLLKDFKGQEEYVIQVINNILTGEPLRDKNGVLIEGEIWNERFVIATMHLVDQRERDGRNGTLNEQGKKMPLIKDKSKYLYSCLFESLMLKEAKEWIKEQERKAAQEAQEREELRKQQQAHLHKLKMEQQAKHNQPPQPPIKQENPAEKLTEVFKSKTTQESRYPKDAFLEHWQVDPDYKNRSYEEYLERIKFKIEGDYIIRV